MDNVIDETSLHRTAKYFMDSGRAQTHEEAMGLLKQFGLTIHVGDEIENSVDHQTALLTLINVARRTSRASVPRRGAERGAESARTRAQLPKGRNTLAPPVSTTSFTRCSSPTSDSRSR